MENKNTDFSDTLIEYYSNTDIVEEECEEDLTLDEVMFSDLYKAVSDPTIKVGDIVTWKTADAPYGTCGKVIKLAGDKVVVSQGKDVTRTIIRHGCSCNCNRA